MTYEQAGSLILGALAYIIVIVFLIQNKGKW